ncbi:MAG: FecR family protein [Bacteroidales bacterium]
MNEIKLLDYLDGKLSKEEAAQVETWSKADSQNREILEQLYYTTFIGERAAAMNLVDVDKSFEKLQMSIAQKERFTPKQRHWEWKRFAIPLAAFLTGVVCTIGFATFTLNDTSKYIVATTAGQRAQFVLPGSKVWLNSSSELTYKASVWSRKRQVDLSGEAYFEVEHNKNAPFIVHSKNIKVQVLGTKFDVRARASENRIVTTLLKGSVRVDLPDNKKESIILKPEQILEVNTNTLQTTLAHTPSARDVLLWMDGKLKFEQCGLEQITRCFEKHFDVRFHFIDEALKQERFTCEFLTDNNITDILSILELTKRFHYEIEGNQVYLSLRK